MDWIRALAGKRWCDWCNDRPPSWFDRFMGLDQLVGEIDRPIRYKIGAWWINIWTEKIQLWRIGQWWHHLRHGEDIYDDEV